ncbi:helix-turn-helix domain-containing protein [Dyadobacter pollutisoli]|jgi:HTH-type transcriptional regulator/antitoxin HigA|uniref:Transcriptional regulator n=1 Tax=Dyadobacter pollutisoli TaxID=2910158 RepID=A0A9E8N7F0_9BACT|nr:transcriptional regulator [Dyadobacter pollutisoli]WAC09312.1 transcriptional regulator [Dyadobacter pollutisoli]
MLKLIKTKEEYDNALKRLGEVFDAPTGTPESDECDVLALLVGAYEDEHYPIDAPDPIEAIKIRMQQLQLKQVDLIEDMGGKNRVSEVLNKKRKLSIEMIRNLSKRLNLSLKVLTQDYHLTQ